MRKLKNEWTEYLNATDIPALVIVGDSDGFGDNKSTMFMFESKLDRWEILPAAIRTLNYNFNG